MEKKEEKTEGKKLLSTVFHFVDGVVRVGEEMWSQGSFTYDGYW